MKQQLKVDLTVTIPDDYVLVEKIEYERLQEVDTYGRWWTLRDVLDRVNRERTWFRDNVLYNSKYHRKIDIENGGFVKFPIKKGSDSYLFLPSKTKQFLEDNFADILKE